MGFNVRQYRIGRYHSGKNSNGTLLGFKTLIKPSQKAIRNHKERLREIVIRHRAQPHAELIAKLNPVIRGWCNYYRTAVSKETFAEIDAHLWHTIWRWAKRRHPNKSGKWITERYWKPGKNRTWNFKDLSQRGKANPTRRH